MVRVFGVGVPIEWVVENVFADAVQVAVVADDVIVIIFLPSKIVSLHSAARGCDGGFVGSYDYAQ